MYQIGLDISTTNTGYAIIKDNKVIHTAVIKSTDTNNMASLIIQTLNKALYNINQPQQQLTVVIESYTETIYKNDRAGIAGDIVHIKQTVTHHLQSQHITVATVLPWSWRRHYHLPTRVRAENADNAYSVKLSRICGHNILKTLSIKYLKDKAGNLGMTSDEVSRKTNDEVEAILIAQSYNISHLLNDSEPNDDVLIASDELLKQYSTTVVVNTARTWGQD